MVLSNPGNAHVSGIAGIAQELLSMTSRLMAQLLGFGLCDCASCGVIVDSKDIVGRRRRHRAGVRRRRPQGQSSHRWPQSAAAWPLVQRGRRRQTRVRDDRVCDSTFSNVNVHMTRATRHVGKGDGRTCVMPPRNR